MQSQNEAYKNKVKNNTTNSKNVRWFFVIALYCAFVVVVNRYTHIQMLILLIHTHTYKCLCFFSTSKALQLFPLLFPVRDTLSGNPAARLKMQLNLATHTHTRICTSVYVWICVALISSCLSTVVHLK